MVRNGISTAGFDVRLRHVAVSVHSFYRAGPVMGSAIAGIDQALWDLRAKILGVPVYKLLGGLEDGSVAAW